MSNLSLSAPHRAASPSPATMQKGVGRGTLQQDWLVIGLLAVLGYGLNVFYLPLFAGVVQMLFGSVAVLIALEVFGLGAGVAVALFAFIHTFFLWHHPYALGIFGLEPLVVYALRRHTRNLVFADVIFWFAVGMPLTWLVYRHPLHFTPDETLLVTFKNGVNGALTSLLASLILLLPQLRHYIAERALHHDPQSSQRPSSPSPSSPVADKATSKNEVRTGGVLTGEVRIGEVSTGPEINPQNSNIQDANTQALQSVGTRTSASRERPLATGVEPSFALLLFNLLVGAAIIPALALTLRHSWIEMESAQLAARASVLSAAEVMDDDLRTWIKDNRVALQALAHSLATNSGAQARQDALLLHDMHPDFAGFVLVDTQNPGRAPQVLLGGATPLLQSQGKAGTVPIVDRSLARPDELTRAAQRALTQPNTALEVRNAGNDPVPVWAISTLLSPNADEEPNSVGTTSGDAPSKTLVGLLRLDSLQHSLNDVPAPGDVHVTVLDGNQRVLAAVPSDAALDGRMFEAPDAGEGHTDTFEDGTRQWWPQSPKLPPLQSWASSVFYAQRESNTQTPWRVLVEAPFRPQEAQLVHGFTINLGWILALMVGAMPLATLLSQRLNRPLEQLAALSTNLPRKLAAQDTTPPEWPQGGMSEVSHLVRNVQQMESALRTNFNALESSRREAVASQREAEEANRLKDEFLAVLSHELRTPLVPIIGYADLLHMSVAGGVIEPDVVGEAARIIERNARAQGALIEDLLDVSRIVAGKMTLKVGVVNLQKLLRESLETVSLRAEERHIKLHLVAPEDVPQIIGDYARLQQVVQNLLNNALKFSPEGSRVLARLDREPEHARITIADEGRGIAAEFLPFIFDRFRQANHDHQTRDIGGLGLGLSIVKTLAELHGGTVEARSEGEGRGSQFIVRLPLNLASMNAHSDLTEAYGDPESFTTEGFTEGFTAEDVAAQLR